MASGLLVFVALPPYDLWWAAWFSLVPLLLAIENAPRKEAALLGLLAGTVANYGAFHWLMQLMEEFTKLGVLRFAIMGVLALYQGVPLMLWTLLLRQPFGCGKGQGARVLAVLLSAWSLPVIEFFYPIVFPWYMANTQHSEIFLSGVIELGGCGLLSLAIVACNLSLARLLVRREVDTTDAPLWPLPATPRDRLALLALGLGALLFCFVFSSVRNAQIEKLQEAAPKLTIGLVQPNHWINQVQPVEALHDYQKLSLELIEESRAAGEPIDLLLWPESAVRTPAPRFISKRGPSNDNDLVRLPMDLVQILPGLSRPAPELSLENAPRWEVLAIQRGHNTPLLFGSTLVDATPGAKGPMSQIPPLYNCGVLLDSTGRVEGIAPKVELLLFGETIPLSQYFPKIYEILPLASALMPGSKPSVLTLGEARLGIMICYEDLLPWFHYRLAKEHPQVLLNLTNDAWFGKTAEAPAHLALAKLRAIEGRVPLIRSTSTGISAFVDATGRLTASIGCDERGTLRETVALLDIETGFERVGDSVVWFGLFLLVVHLALRAKRKR